ncbi:hypothetical protein [Polaromonas sp.]
MKVIRTRSSRENAAKLTARHLRELAQSNVKKAIACELFFI